MPRKIVVELAERDGTRMLVETPAEDERQLQELVKDNPDLLPIEEFGLTGPLLTIGRETTLPSGSVDLVALARGGDLLIIEFKTGPENTDFRHAITQLLDYGSDMWQMSYEDFEQTVPLRYFAGPHCKDPKFQQIGSLIDACRTAWPDFSEDEFASVQEKLDVQLRGGTFHYVLVAQRFTSTIERTVEYMNASTKGSKFYAVELVRFRDEDRMLNAFESRTVFRPGSSMSSGGTTGHVTEAQFLEAIGDEEYREALHQLLEVSHGLDLKFELGAAGISIRLLTQEHPEPVTVLWLFPPGKSGYLGLTDVSIGYASWQADRAPKTKGILSGYLENVRQLPGAGPVKTESITAYRLAPADFVSNRATIVELLAKLVEEANQVSV